MSGLIVHEWVSARGGSENVFEAMAEAFPDADLATLWDDTHTRFPGRELAESWLSRTPLRRSKAASLPLMPLVWRRMVDRAKRYDWLLVSSHAFAHHVRTPGAEVPKLVYAHTPARYIWSPELDPRGASIAARFGGALLKPLDRTRAAEATEIAANSGYVRDRIRSAWGRDARVIYPPVEVRRIASRTDWDAAVVDPAERRVLDALPERFVLAASRLVAYKRIDRAVDAGRLSGLPVVVAGDGPERDRLEETARGAGVSVQFLGRPSDELLYAVYRRATVLVFLGIEDFGIIPVEAMAAGAPVVANRVGGASESVVDGVSGFLVDAEDDEALRTAVVRSASLDRQGVAASAERFSRERFESELRDWVTTSAS